MIFTFPSSQFHNEGYSMSNRLDTNRNEGGVLIYIKGSVCNKVLNKQILPGDIKT